MLVSIIKDKQEDLGLEGSQNHTASVRWRSVALPTEHGGWSFVSEPLLLGLLLAPSWGGLTISLTTLGAFLLRHPLKIYAKDVLNKRSVPRTYAARQFMLIYAGVTGLAGVITLLLIPSSNVLLPLLLALPLFALQLAYDVRNQSRSAVAEIAGAVATGALASTIVMMQGWSLSAALGLWLVIAVKAISTIIYVRARLRLEREQPAGLRLAYGVQVISILVLVIATAYGFARWTAIVAMIILAARAALGLSSWRKARPPKIIGMQEIAYGLGFLLLIAAGYWLG